MIYKDEKLKDRPLDPSLPAYNERKMLRELGGWYIEDPSKSFKENLSNFYVHSETTKTLKSIIELKSKLFQDTGVVL